MYFEVIREIKNHSPPFTSPFVQMADIDKVVNVVTIVAKSTIPEAIRIPASPTTHGNLKNSITPQIFRIVGTKTPFTQPNLAEWFLISIDCFSFDDFYKCKTFCLKGVRKISRANWILKYFNAE